MAARFHVKSYIILPCEFNGLLHMFCSCRIDDIDRIATAAAGSARIRNTGIVVPVVVCVAYWIIFVKRPRCKPLCRDSWTESFIVIRLSGMTDSTRRRRLEEYTAEGFVEACPFLIRRPLL